jgi:hypothetical protein
VHRGPTSATLAGSTLKIAGSLLDGFTQMVNYKTLKRPVSLINPSSFNTDLRPSRKNPRATKTTDGIYDRKTQPNPPAVKTK